MLLILIAVLGANPGLVPVAAVCGGFLAAILSRALRKRS